MYFIWKHFFLSSVLSLGAGNSVSHRLASLYHSIDLANAHAVVGARDVCPVGVSIVVGPAQPASEGDVCRHLPAFHPHGTGVVGWDHQVHRDGVTDRLRHFGSL